jgi:hypothetical protein
MIGATVAMAAVAAMFVVFGLFALADGKRCDGACGTCTKDCENELEGKVT